jgi:hypothetical protein
MSHDTIDAPQSSILTVRLKKPKQHKAFQSNVELAAGEVPGDLLDWMQDDWLYLTQGSEQLLAGRLANTGKTVDAVLRDAGALDVKRIPYGEFVQAMRERGVHKDYLPDYGASGVAMPGVVGEEVSIGGKTYRLDWQLTISGIHRAWGLFPQTPGALPWAAVRVAHLDTGCTPHPALGFSNGTNGSSSYIRTDLGKNLFADYLAGQAKPDLPAPPPENAGPIDNLSGGFPGHGTRTLSVLAGFYDVATDEIPPFWGAAPGVEVIPYRVTDSIFIDHVQQQLAEAIDDAVAQGCRVVSMSLGGIAPWHKLADAIDRAYEAGVIVCAAAGNVIREVTYPGRYNRVLTLGGVSPDGKDNFRPWHNSSRGQFVDVCGPAEEIRRASIALRKGKLEPFIAGGGNGTSFATAQCAGIAALWLAKRKADLETQYGPPDWRWPAAFKTLIKQTAIRPSDWDTANFGAGLYQADKLLAADLPPLPKLHREAAAYEPFDPKA